MQIFQLIIFLLATILGIAFGLVGAFIGLLILGLVIWYDEKQKDKGRRR